MYNDFPKKHEKVKNTLIKERMTTNFYSQNIDEINLQVKKDLKESKNKIQRLKVKALLKTIATVFLLVGGVVTSLILPNPISGAIVIGSTAILGGSEGIKHSLKRMKDVKKTKKIIKDQDKITSEQIFVNKVKKDLEKDPSDPSAPPSLMMYPNLRI